MRFVDWISKNNDMVYNRVKTIVKDKDEVDDLYQCVMEQLLKQQHKIDDIKDEQKLYYVIRVVKNNYHSKTSPYHYQFRKHKEKQLPIIEDVIENIQDVEYKETLPDMEWVKRQLNTLDWFSRDLFLLWMELSTISKVSEQTKIPLNSVSRYINKIKRILQERWKQEL
jgi:DNA-directed RNA polymerase specialized sigma24 family protein